MPDLQWDEFKRRANLDKHGLDFKDVEDFDWAGAMVGPARPSRFGGKRLKAVGYFDGDLVAVIFALLGSEAISVISFRPAGDNERKAFRDENEARD